MQFNSTLIKSILFRLIIFTAIWWGFTQGHTGSWGFGVPVILISLVISLILLPPVHFNALAFARFLPFFLLHSLLGGIDVARRVLGTKCDIDPVIQPYTLQLPEGFPRFFMLCIINLLPGTLSVRLVNDRLELHILNSQSDYHGELEILLHHVKCIFNCKHASTKRDKLECR